MPQENKKISKAVRSRILTKDSPSPSIRSEDQEIVGREKSDVERQRDLEPCKSADDMPEREHQDLENDEEISLDLCEPPPEVIEYARRELGETDEVKCQSLQELRDMIYGNSN